MTNSLLAGLQQVPNARTANGDAAHATTYNSCLDMFANIGSARKTSGLAVRLFNAAFAENLDVAVRTALWARDVRGGAGERQAFRDILVALANKEELIRQIVPKVAEVGRWDDLLVLMHTPAEQYAVSEIANALVNGNGLCAKWMPRKGPVASALRKAFGMTPKQYRKLVVQLTDVVETKMCAQQWDTIEYGKLPSLAAARYQKAFTKHSPTKYAAYMKGLENGTEKVNASAIFPHDVLHSALSGGQPAVSNAQWKALPDYMEGTDQRVLAMVDVSGSMGCGINGGSSYSARDGVSCMKVAVALGMYCAERNNGPFKDHFVTFTRSPLLVKSNPSQNLADRYREATRHVGYDTNIDAAYDLILNTAVQHNVPQSDMPTMLLVLSDMQFNSGDVAGMKNKTAHDRVVEKFKRAGYEMPALVYWNLNAQYGNSPITQHASGACLVSGYSPAVLKSVLSATNITPVDIMMDTIMSDRYRWQQDQ